MATARAIIKAAMRNATVLRRGFTATDEDLQEGLEAANRFLDYLSSENIMVPYRTRESFNPPSVSNSYSIGPSGDFNTVRPIKIEAITITAGSNDYPVNIGDLEMYNAITYKPEGGIADNAYYEPTHPTGTIYFDYRPDTTYTIVIDSLKPLTALASLDTTFTFPPGYQSMVEFNLAEFLCLEGGRPVPGHLSKWAEKTMNAVLSSNLVQRLAIAKVDNALVARGGYNILKDQ